jgi:hypothetical protein
VYYVRTEKNVGVKANKVEVTQRDENIQELHLRACGGRKEGR